MTAAFAMLDALEDRAELLCHIDPRDRFPLPEEDRQAALLSELRRRAPGVTVWAVPNGGKRTRWAASKAKREGMRKGAPDLTITWNRGVAFVEMKNGTDKPDADQVLLLNALYRAGHHVGVFRTAASAVAWLIERGAPIRAERAGL